MNQSELIDVIRRQLYTRRIDIKTGKPIADYDLLEEFQRVVKKNNERIIKTISNSNSQYFHVLNHFQGDVSDLTESANIVSCLFPKRLIITSFVRQGEFKYLLASIYERFGTLIENDIIELYVDFSEYETAWVPENNEKRPDTMKEKNIHLLTQSYTTLDYNQDIKVSLPWLQNARHEDYIELVNKYNLQFDNYSRQIDKIAKIAKNPNELTSLLINETKDAFIDIRIALEKTQTELMKKGIKTIVGAIATAIPFLVPIDNAYISPELLGSILGATNVISTVPPIIDSSFEISKIGRENPYWLLWKWNKVKT